MRIFHHSCEFQSKIDSVHQVFIFCCIRNTRDSILSHIAYTFFLISFLHFIISRLHTHVRFRRARHSSFSCGHFSMHAGLSAALRTCVTHSSLLVVVQATDVSYRTRRNDVARLQRERTGDNGTDGTRDRKVAVSNA